MTGIWLSRPYAIEHVGDRRVKKGFARPDLVKMPLIAGKATRLSLEWMAKASRRMSGGRRRARVGSGIGESLSTTTGILMFALHGSLDSTVALVDAFFTAAFFLLLLGDTIVVAHATRLH